MLWNPRQTVQIHQAGRRFTVARSKHHSQLWIWGNQEFVLLDFVRMAEPKLGKVPHRPLPPSLCSTQTLYGDQFRIYHGDRPRTRLSKAGLSRFNPGKLDSSKTLRGHFPPPHDGRIPGKGIAEADVNAPRDTGIRLFLSHDRAPRSGSS